MKKGNKILLIGPYPPPSGGVSIHIQRLLEKGRDHSGFEMAACDPRRLRFNDREGARRNIFWGLSFFVSASIVHIHLAHRWRALIGRVAKIFGKKVIFTLHSIRSASNSELKTLAEIGRVIHVYPNEDANNGMVIPAYIPPRVSREKVAGPPQEIQSLLDKAKLIVAVSTASKKQSQEEDIYGFDLVLDAINYLDGINLLFFLIDVNGTHQSRYRERIEKQNGRDNGITVFYMTGEYDLTSFLQFANVFVRPTRSDGDSLAVREALSAGVPVVASDCVRRPEGCILFRNDDEKDLAEKINVAFLQERKVVPQPDFSDRLFELYKSLL